MRNIDRVNAPYAIEIDPRYARAHIAVAFNHYLDYLYGWSQAPELSLSKMGEFAVRAVELDDSECEAHWILVDFYYVSNQHEEVIAEHQRALALNPNNPDVLAEFGWNFPFLATGKAEEAVSIVRRAMRLNPFYPDWYEQGLGICTVFSTTSRRSH